MTAADDRRCCHYTVRIDRLQPLAGREPQLLANLNSSYEIVSDMRAVPFGLEDIFRLGAATAAPVVPLLLTIFPLEELEYGSSRSCSKHVQARCPLPKNEGSFANS